MGDRILNHYAIRIRRARPADFPAIAHLINKCFDIDRAYIEEPDETKSSVAADMKDGMYFVAVDGKRQTIGCVYLHHRLQAIFKLAVEPSMRKQGYGRKLMTEAEKYGKGEGWSIARIAILNFRLDLLDYYQKLGYGDTGMTRPIAPPAMPIQPCHLIIMSKKIS